jgi:phosphoadenosine phosphosulfate reductase
MPDNVPELEETKGLIDSRDPVASIRRLCARFPGRVVFSTSFGMEDQVITDLISESDANVIIFTLDTGRMFPETYSTWKATLDRYRIPIAAETPDSDELGRLLSENGPNGFYESVGKRKECCRIRKVEPLRRRLAGQSVWITGLRASQSAERAGLEMTEWDGANGIVKYHPLLAWTTEEIKQRLRERNIPYNPLHDRGFPSIGCAPCTRAVGPEEDERAGRWWWELNNGKECGLHAR